MLKWVGCVKKANLANLANQQLHDQTQHVLSITIKELCWLSDGGAFVLCSSLSALVVLESVANANIRRKNERRNISKCSSGHSNQANISGLGSRPNFSGTTVCTLSDAWG